MKHKLDLNAKRSKHKSTSKQAEALIAKTAASCISREKLSAIASNRHRCVALAILEEINLIARAKDFEGLGLLGQLGGR